MVFKGRETSQGTFAAPSRGFGEQSCSKSSISLPVHLGSVRACVRACWRGVGIKMPPSQEQMSPLPLQTSLFTPNPGPKR